MLQNQLPEDQTQTTPLAPTPSPPPLPSPIELRSGVLENLRYEPDKGDLSARSRNVVRFVEKHPELRGKAIALRKVLDEIRAEVPTTMARSADLSQIGIVCGPRWLDLPVERHRGLRSTGDKRRHRKAYLRLSHACLATARAWIKRSAAEIDGCGDVIE